MTLRITGSAFRVVDVYETGSGLEDGAAGIWGGAIEPLYASSLFVRAVVVAMVAGTIGGLYPAWRATRLRPVEALRYERVGRCCNHLGDGNEEKHAICLSCTNEFCARVTTPGHGLRLKGHSSYRTRERLLAGEVRCKATPIRGVPSALRFVATQPSCRRLPVAHHRGLPSADTGPTPTACHAWLPASSAARFARAAGG